MGARAGSGNERHSGMLCSGVGTLLLFAEEARPPARGEDSVKTIIQNTKNKFQLCFMFKVLKCWVSVM